MPDNAPRVLMRVKLQAEAWCGNLPFHTTHVYCMAYNSQFRKRIFWSKVLSLPWEVNWKERNGRVI